jgi:flagellar hook-associated protein 2
MAETISNDYVSMINKKGSGYNIPVIVDAIVDAAIIPMKEIVTAKKEKVDGAISGMAALKSSALLSQTTINTLSGYDDFTLGSTDANTVSLTINDRSKLDGFSHTITNVTTAKPMIMHVKNWTSLTTDLFEEDYLDITVNGVAIDASLGGVSGRIDIDSDTATELTAKLDAINGLKAQMVKISDTSYTMVVTSEPGSTFTIAAPTPNNQLNSSGTHTDTDVSAASVASLTFDGVDITRSSNKITDLIEGVSINLLADNEFDSDASTAIPAMVTTTVTASRSATKIQATVESLIAELNLYKADLNALGFIDEVGDANGQLANNSFLRHAKQKLLNLMTAPITGYGDGNIYFVEFGIKTAVDGSYVFDRATFDRTYSQAPEKFDALTQDKAYGSDPNVFVNASAGSTIPSGKHVFTDSDNKLKTGTSTEKVLTVTSSAPYTFSTSDYPGFSFQASSATPGDFNVYIGRSAKTKLFNFFADALTTSGSHDKVVDLYKNNSTSLGAKLTKIDQREARLQAMYTKQFSDMEKAVNGYSSSEDYITQLVDGWNKS